MKALPEPERGELIESLREFVNLESDADFRLLIAWLVAALWSTGLFPVLILIGQQGTAKSTLARICRLLIDPNAAPIRSVPKDERDLVVSASNGWTMVYDNLSSLPEWLSDALCRISTGGGFATRTLHSDRDETIFDATRPIVLNGIGEIGTRGDLTDPAISLTLSPLADDKRRSERALWTAFAATRPGILGALLDAVAAGIRDLAGTRLDRPPRMADFAQFIEAASPGLGWAPGEFLADYAEWFAIADGIGNVAVITGLSELRILSFAGSPILFRGRYLNADDWTAWRSDAALVELNRTLAEIIQLKRRVAPIVAADRERRRRQEDADRIAAAEAEAKPAPRTLPVGFKNLENTYGPGRSYSGPVG